jgi:hypothetical protein
MLVCFLHYSFNICYQNIWSLQLRQTENPFGL